MSGGQDDAEAAVSRLSAFGALDPGELAGLSEIAGPERVLSRGDILWREGDRLPGLFLLTDGWIASVREFENARLMIKAHMPGDLLGLPSLAFTRAGESAIALSEAIVRPLRLHSFGALFEAHPRVAAMTYMVSQQERMDLTDRMVRLQKGQPIARIAAMFAMLSERVSRAFPDGCEVQRLPLSNADLADLAGVSSAGLAAGLRTLREANILAWSRQRLTIFDAQALIALADLPHRKLAEDPHWMPSAGSPRF